MCLAIPMRILTIDGHKACCESKSVRRDVSLTLLLDENVAVGDYVLVHVGYALQIISEADAQLAWDLFDEVSETLDRVDA